MRFREIKAHVQDSGARSCRVRSVPPEEALQSTACAALQSCQGQCGLQSLPFISQCSLFHVFELKLVTEFSWFNFFKKIVGVILFYISRQFPPLKICRDIVFYLLKFAN